MPSTMLMSEWRNVDTPQYMLTDSVRASGFAPEPKTIEAKCLFDADKPDALGVIGIVRSAFISFENGQEFYKEEKDIEVYKRRNIRADGTIIDFSKHLSNLEYELSLKWITNRMYTSTAKRLAEGRAAFMNEFYDRIGKQLRGVL